MKNIIAIIIVIASIIGGLFLFYSKNASAPAEPSNNTPPPQIQENLPGMQTSDAPWKAESEHLRERLVAIGLPALAEEGNVLHTHQHLDIYINGNPMVIPAGIGMNQLENFVSPMHAHAPDNIIHIESPEVRDFTLGQFFDIWGVRFSSECIGGYCTNDKNKLRVFVNGQEAQNDPRQIKLEEQQEIAITYGTEQEMPSPIPQSYPLTTGE